MPVSALPSYSLKDLPLTTDKEKALAAFEGVVLARILDDKMSKLSRQNKGGNFHLFTAGHELVGIVCGQRMIPGKDWALPYYRDRAVTLGLGASYYELLAAFLARDIENHSGGRMMPEHFSQKELNLPCQSSCVGSQFLHAVGVALGLKLKNDNGAVYVSGGDGSTSQGDFHEALNFSSIHKLGVIFVIQDNGWAISVPLAEQTAGSSIASWVGGYPGIETVEVDGCSYLDLSHAMEKAVERARNFAGPTVIVAKVPRLGPHSSSDDPAKYKSQDQCTIDRSKDPLALFERYMISEGYLDSSEIASLKETIQKSVDLAAFEADKLPHPEASTALDHLFKETSPRDLNEDAEMDNAEEIVIMDALNHALQEEMEQDPNMFVFGQDVAHGKGGVFGITRKLTELFGKDRCFNTPLAESTIIGIAIGLSFVEGIKPVAEIQFADYLWTGINQLINELASIHYRSKGLWNCPVVVRMPYGGYIQGGPYHSQSIEAFLAHCPGLKIVIPSNAADAKRLLKMAIRDPNPVVFLEHKALYRQRLFCARKEPSSTSLLPLGKAHIVRSGNHITLLAWGMMVVQGVTVVDQLRQEGIEVELIDLRTLVPLDKETIINSVKKTGKVLIAHEAHGFCGYGAELAAIISSEAFEYLDAPIARLTGKGVPIPYSKVLEDAVLPQSEDLMDAIRKLAKY